MHPCVIAVDVGACKALHCVTNAPFALMLDDGKFVLPKLG